MKKHYLMKIIRYRQPPHTYDRRNESKHEATQFDVQMALKQAQVDKSNANMIVDEKTE